jgi:hypothetical protein
LQSSRFWRERQGRSRKLRRVCRVLEGEGRMETRGWEVGVAGKGVVLGRVRSSSRRIVLLRGVGGILVRLLGEGKKRERGCREGGALGKRLER